MDHSNDTLLLRLRAYVGRYEGRGMNHDQQPFTGRLALTETSDGGVRVQFEATGDDETLYHREETRIARTHEGLELGTTSTNHAGLLRYVLRRTQADDGLALTFGFGDPDDDTVFRSEIRVSLHESGAVTYAHAWGLPGGAFAERSGARMRRM